MQQQLLLNLIQCIDLTSLGYSDNESIVLDLINRANKGFQDNYPAAVCVFSNHTYLLEKELNKNIKSAIVAGYFPSGQASLEQKQNEYELIAKTSVDEVDIVINRGELIAENFDFISQEIDMARNILATKTLKVIIESGDLNKNQIAFASRIAIEKKADFIKTSTGKGKVGATLEAAQIICREIKKSNKLVGFKASGGIRTLKDAILYSESVSEILGEQYLSKKLFRIGASSLFQEIIKEFNKNE